jgi:hypothetical protein
MTKKTLVISPSINLSQEHLGDFEKHTRDIKIVKEEKATMEKG